MFLRFKESSVAKVRVTIFNSIYQLLTSYFVDNSVKHLTCWYWLNRGICKKSDLECAYSHFDTGKYADKPLPLIPGCKFLLQLLAKSSSKIDQ